MQGPRGPARHHTNTGPTIHEGIDMAHTPPTLNEFKTRFPQFADVSDPLLQMVLDEAMTQVDDSWLDQDYKNAIMYLMAHLLTTEGVLDGGETGTNPGPIASESFGPISRSYAIKGSTSQEGYDFQSTEFGRRFYYLMRRNFPAIVVV
jgi:hypothetical protein